MENPMVFAEVDDPFGRFAVDPELVCCSNCGMEFECEGYYDDFDDCFCEECSWVHGSWDF